jgi:putative transposase
MGIRRTKHAVYDVKYQVVWIPKYRKHIVDKEDSDYRKTILSKVGEEYGFRIDTMEVMEDHVEIFVEVTPSYFPAWVVQVMKSISAREVFRKFPELREQLWAGGLWSDG